MMGICIKGNTNINMDMNQMKFGFADNEFKINDLPLKAKGWIKMGETDMDMDIDIDIDIEIDIE